MPNLASLLRGYHFMIAHFAPKNKHFLNFDQSKLTPAKRDRQGCQMVRFYTKNHNLGKFLRVSQWKMLVHFMSIGFILRPLGLLFCGFSGHLVYFSRFGVSYQEKSGNPGDRPWV
jgi:hypothetical protein